MGVDNYAVCPKCYKKKAGMHVKKVEKCYGKIDLERYRMLMSTAENKDRQYGHEKYTLRVGFELGISFRGRFEIKYSCFCPVCKFSHSHVHIEDVDIK